MLMETVVCQSYFKQVHKWLDFSHLTGSDSRLWQVPVTIATRKNPEAMKFVLDKASMTVTVEGVGPDDWILVIIVINTHK